MFSIDKPVRSLQWSSKKVVTPGTLQLSILETGEIIIRALVSDPMAQRALILRYLQCKSYREPGEAPAYSEHQARRYLKKACRRLRICCRQRRNYKACRAGKRQDRPPLHFPHRMRWKTLETTINDRHNRRRGKVG